MAPDVGLSARQAPLRAAGDGRRTCAAICMGEAMGEAALVGVVCDSFSRMARSEAGRPHADGSRRIGSLAWPPLPIATPCRVPKFLLKRCQLTMRLRQAECVRRIR